jgi:conjugal transfer ATP-binding protein TraC
VQAAGGEFVEFTMSAGFRLNPFSMIDGAEAAPNDDYRLDCMAMLKAIIGQMARPTTRLDDTEAGWSTARSTPSGRRGEGSIDGVIARSRRRAIRRARPRDRHAPVLERGHLRQVLRGRASLIGAALTVFELSDLASREELRSVVLSAIMFLSSQAMREDRATRKALLLDEAWQMLKGGSMAEFIEAYARTCRKYGGSLITATQSLNDYYKSEGSVAALENSDWSVILQQKPETITDFAKHGRFDLSDGSEALMRSLKRNGTEYSDLMIRARDARRRPPRARSYSATVFSSSPQVFAAVERCRARLPDGAGDRAHRLPRRSREMVAA